MRRCARLVTLALVLGPAAARAAELPVVIGLLLPPGEPAAGSIRRGALLAVEEAAAGGLPVRLAVRGRTGAWGSDATEAARLVEDDGAAALIGPPDGAGTHLALQIAGRTGVPVASLCPDLSVTRSAVPWMVRVAPSDADEARSIFGAAGGARWLAVVPRGRAGREAARDLASAAGPRALHVEEEPSGERLAELVRARRIDGVLLWVAPAPAARLSRALRGAGFRGTLAGPSRLDAASFRSAAGDAARGFLVPALRRGSPEGTRFSSRYRARHGQEPDSSALLAHDAALLLAALVRSAGAEGARRAFPLLRALPGASGPLAFDTFGNRIVVLTPIRLDGGGAARPGGRS